MYVNTRFEPAAEFVSQTANTIQVISDHTNYRHRGLNYFEYFHCNFFFFELFRICIESRRGRAPAHGRPVVPMFILITSHCAAVLLSAETTAAGRRRRRRRLPRARPITAAMIAASGDRDRERTDLVTEFRIAAQTTCFHTALESRGRGFPSQHPRYVRPFSQLPHPSRCRLRSPRTVRPVNPPMAKNVKTFSVSDDVGQS